MTKYQISFAICHVDTLDLIDETGCSRPNCEGVCDIRHMAEVFYYSFSMA